MLFVSLPRVKDEDLEALVTPFFFFFFFFFFKLTRGLKMTLEWHRGRTNQLQLTVGVKTLMVLLFEDKYVDSEITVIVRTT
jgi:hypothetical protein